MRCLFAVSSWFVQCASLTVNIDISDVTNTNYTVLYRTVVVYEKKNRSLVFSGSRKIPTLGSTVQWETRQASFPTGTVGPRVGIFLSPLNTNDEFYLSHMGSDVGQIFPTASLHRDHSILYALVCEKNRIHHWCSVGTEKSQPEGPPFQWETRLAEFPTKRWTRGLGFFWNNWTPMIDSFSHIPRPYGTLLCNICWWRHWGLK